jgi:hypothetical protein
MKVLLHSWERRKCKYPDFPEVLPDSWFNEEWAEKVHTQSLEHLNSRGGLGPEEMIMNMERLSIEEFRKLTLDGAMERLLEKLKNEQK